MYLKKEDLSKGNTIRLFIEGIYVGLAELLEKKGNTSAEYDRGSVKCKSEIWRVRVCNRIESAKFEYQV